MTSKTNIDITLEYMIKLLLSLEYCHSTKLSLDELAKEANYSKFHLSRLFKQKTGYSLIEFARSRKLFQSAEKIIDGCKLIDVSYEFGYESSSAFSRAFKREFGISPQVLRLFTNNVNQSEGDSTMTAITMRSFNKGSSLEDYENVLIEITELGKSQVNKNQLNKVLNFCKDKFANIYRQNGEAYFSHPLRIAIILVDLGANEDLVFAGLATDILKKTNCKENELIQIIGINSYTILTFPENKIAYEHSNEAYESSEVLKLVERLDNMRTIEGLDLERQKQKAIETLELFIHGGDESINARISKELIDLSIKVLRRLEVKTFV